MEAEAEKDESEGQKRELKGREKSETASGEKIHIRPVLAWVVPSHSLPQ